MDQQYKYKSRNFEDNIDKTLEAIGMAKNFFIGIRVVQIIPRINK